MIASPSQSTTQLLDLFISKQAELKKLETFLTDIRKQIQTAIEMGELESLDDQGRYVYDNLQIQVVERKSWKYSHRCRCPQRKRAIQWKRHSDNQCKLSIRRQGLSR